MTTQAPEKSLPPSKTTKKTTEKAAQHEKARLVSLASRRRAPGPVPTPELIRLIGEADADVMGRWAACTAAQAPNLRKAIDLAEDGMELPEIAGYLNVPLVEVWDRALEAQAAILETVGLPVVNRWLEEQLRKHGLLPAGAASFPCDIGWVLRHLPRRMRETAYARISCRGVEVPTVWGVKVPTYNNRLSNLKRVLILYTYAAGVVKAPTSMPTVPLWLIAYSIDLGAGSPLMYWAAERAGLPRKGDYTWAEARLIWDAAVGSDAYRRAILQESE
jgi:hypothetical protein